MKRRFSVSSAVFFALATIMIAIMATSFLKALGFLNKPFPGFFLYQSPYVGSFSSSDWPGKKAGLKYLDRVVEVDGQQVWEGADVIAAAKLKTPGEFAHYLVESKGKVSELAIPVDFFDMKDFLLIFSIVFLVGSIVYIIGVVVYLLKPNIRASWVFLISSFSLGTYMVTGFDIQSSYSLARLHYVSLCLIPPTFFHLFLIFPDKKRILGRWPFLEYLIYVPALILILGYQINTSLFKEVIKPDGLSWVPAFPQLGALTRVLMAFCTLGLIAFVLHSIYKASTAQARQRAKMILFGVTMAFAPPTVIMAFAFLTKYDFPWNFFPFFIIFFPASIAYSIVRHNLFDADVIIKRTVGYAVVTGVVVAAYSGVSVGLNIFAGHYQLSQSQAFPILFTLGVILVFNPLRDRIQAIVDRIFFRKEYDAGKIMDAVGGAMTSLLELGQILKRLVETFVEDMFISTGSVMLLDPARAEYVVAMAGGEKQSDVLGKVYARKEPLFEIIEIKKRELTKYDVIEDPQYSDVCLTCSNQFDALHASLMIPLVYQGEVIGVFNLGEKKSGKSFYREDIDLFRAIASQGAVAIENARLFQENLEKQRMEEELNIARDLQMSMLPASCPEIRGFEIAASSMPAREVGGDFYDFIEMGEDKAGLVVGDVTGKSVSGALVMSSSRSVFRMLSEEKLSVGDIMVRANRRIKQDIKAGMFVALLYAVLDGRDGIVSFCSAGQTQPIHYSAARNEAVLIETDGDNFPLGILDEVDYQETTLKLSPGDRVIFYTDGIVEAMNAKDEMFGFERLLALVGKAGAMSANALHEEILRNVSEFAGGTPQHDDLTVIVASM